MMTLRMFRILVVAAASGFTLSCSTIPSSEFGLEAYQAYDVPAKLPTHPDQVRVKVSLSRQRTYVMEGSRILMVMPVSVGAPETRTPVGEFSITQKIGNKRNLTRGYASSGSAIKKTSVSARPAGYSFKGTPLPFWCGFTGSYGFHTGWIRHHPCTDGCIRMHENLAPKFFHLVRVGTPVSIAYSQPEDATAGNIPLPPDAGPLPDYPEMMYFGEGYFKQHKPPGFN